MKTISVLREELAAAQAAYLEADIEHPTASTLAKDNLANARHEYQHACVGVIERLISCQNNEACSEDVLNIINCEVWA